MPKLPLFHVKQPLFQLRRLPQYQHGNLPHFATETDASLETEAFAINKTAAVPTPLIYLISSLATETPHPLAKL